jgi:hypothetical protein
MISTLKNHFTLRFGLIILGSSLVLTGLDTAVNSSGAPLVESDLLPTLPISTKRTATSNSNRSLDDYATFDVAKVVTADVNDDVLQTEIGMNETEQAQQQGLIPKLYIGDKMYRLDALVKRLQASALLKVTSTAGTEVKDDIVALQLGDILGPYTVTDINSRRLELSAGERKIWLALFTPQSGKPEAETSPLTSNVKQ